MRIAKDRVVSLQIETSDLWGNLIDRTEEPVQYLQGGYGDIFPVLEAALEGRAEKECVEVRLEPQDAYGDYDESLLRVEPLESFPEALAVGMRLGGTAFGETGDIIYTVTDIAEDKVILDGNHPLAGLALNFKCTVVEVRPATETELENGSADEPSSVILRVLP
jgi:FKBP-type peptidyl-prolyl cis-trans isomerase SlyD